ncbi:TRAP transporter small permease subunit [Chelatococcus reniformis]|uniref:TRAP transporter small permease protein n=1 Tax=Chelatococcus reniformis TaxID=1494448 RepID=A0A916UWE4_9HYPH|nr:TRAP transporter small permease subunit [Chelatococcus reniformis]GGC91239.1 C4-dicarboxylate ABC transporter [Chelatococcus reniformis]
MQGLLRLSRGIDFVSKQVGGLANWMVLITVLVSAGNATIRYLFNSSSNSWLEIQWYLFGALVLLGASYTLQRNEHVRVDLIYSSVSDQGRLWIDAVGFTLFLLPVTIFLTWLTWPFFLASFRSGEYGLNAGGLIQWPIKLMLPLGFGLLTLQGLSELIKRVAALTGSVAIDTHYEKPLQ